MNIILKWHLYGSGPDRLGEIPLEGSEVSPSTGSYECVKQASPAKRARSNKTAHARSPRADVSNKKQTKQYFRWLPEMIENLINCLSSYKSVMEYRSLNFDADKPAQYKYLRKEREKLYADEDDSLF